jgi:hypothetical protein
MPFPTVSRIGAIILKNKIGGKGYGNCGYKPEIEGEFTLGCFTRRTWWVGVFAGTNCLGVIGYAIQPWDIAEFWDSGVFSGASTPENRHQGLS